ncbi:MAG: phage integrase SAM-like domain-containing protein [Rikenellaceae bacterium]
MASIIIYVRTKATDPNAKVKVRVKVNVFLNQKVISAHSPIGVEVPKKAWDLKKNVIKSGYETEFKQDKDHISDIKERINASLNAVFPNDGSEPTAELTSAWLKAVIQGYWDGLQLAEDKATAEQLKLEKEIEAERLRVTLNQFIEKYITEIENGTRLTAEQLRFSKGTIKSIKTSMVQFKEFQAYIKRELNFNDIDQPIHKLYTTWLTSTKGYKPNSVGKCIKDLKSVLNKAMEEKLHNNTEFKSKSFK